MRRAAPPRGRPYRREERGQLPRRSVRPAIVAFRALRPAEAPHPSRARYGWRAMVDLSLLKLKSMKEQVTPEEWRTRVDLAACYRLVAHYGMSDMMANHISAAVPGEDRAFLINPYGMMYEEITASSLIKVDLDGNI